MVFFMLLLLSMLLLFTSCYCLLFAFLTLFSVVVIVFVLNKTVFIAGFIFNAGCPCLVFVFLLFLLLFSLVLVVANNAIGIFVNWKFTTPSNKMILSEMLLPASTAYETSSGSNCWTNSSLMQIRNLEFVIYLKRMKTENFIIHWQKKVNI